MASRLCPKSSRRSDRGVSLGTSREGYSGFRRDDCQYECSGFSLTWLHGFLSAYGTHFCGYNLMTDIAIRAQHLCKRYTINRGKHQHNTLRDQIMASISQWLPRRTQSKQKVDIWALKDVS